MRFSTRRLSCGRRVFGRLGLSGLGAPAAAPAALLGGRGLAVRLGAGNDSVAKAIGLGTRPLLGLLIGYAAMV